jgi:DNA polymerase III epsilon subunit-like protein
MSEQIVYLDTETTGLNGIYAGGSDEIVELTIIDDDGNPLIDTLIRPAIMTSWPHAEKIHGISPDMVASAPSLDSVLNDIRRGVSGKTVVIYNSAFDIKFFPPDIFADANVQCCMRRYSANGRNVSLREAAAAAGHQWTGVAHRALADTLATRAVWHHLELAEHPTWNSQIPVNDPAQMIQALRAAGLPLANNESAEGDSEQSHLVCIAEVRPDGIHAVVAFPSGLVFRFQPSTFEFEFWNFAARYYYFVTGNMADRRHVASLTGVDIKEITGRTLRRGKEEALSGMKLDEILAHLGVGVPASQGGLF